jgi:hypothetical protein
MGAKMSRNYFKSERANAGAARRFDEAMAALPEGAEPDTSVYEAVADWVFDKYDLRIRAKLARVGLKLPEDGPLTVEAVRDLVRSRSGLELEDLTPDAIMKAVDAELAKQLSERLGFTVSTVFDAEVVKAEVKAQLLEKLANGDGAGILKGRALTRLRSVATFARAGFTPDEAKKVMNRIYQKRYRRRNKEVWVT